MIKSIFYARFHPEKGPRVLHQVPEDSVVATSQARADQSNNQQPLFDFSAVSDLLIPRQEFCDRLVTVCVNRYRVIGFPVCIQDARYDRNQFIFNLALVLDQDADFGAHASVVRKLASLFRNLEEQSRFLSKEEEVLRPFVRHDGASLSHVLSSPSSQRTTIALNDANDEEDTQLASMASSLVLDDESNQSTKVYAICEMIMEDLNSCCECKIPIDEANTLDLKLFQARPPPAPVYPWHVPLSTVQLQTLSISSDLTMTRIIPYIDGVASVSQISQLADTDLGLTRKALAHLLYYKCILLLDVFQFSAIYAPTAGIASFVHDDEAQEECIRYISVGHYRRLKADELGPSASSGDEQWAFKPSEAAIDKMTLLQLYASLRHGLTLKNWCIEHGTFLRGIDVRRFITFGIIRGFLYRVHKYAYDDSGYSSPGPASVTEKPVSRPNVDSGQSTPWRDSRRGSAAPSHIARDLPLAQYLDGLHSFDEICTSLQLSEKKLSEKMKSAYPEAYIIHR